MTARRQARAASTADDTGGLPSHFLAGPCIEDWRGDPYGVRPDWQAARFNWMHAVYEWGETMGMDRNKARDLAYTKARITHPWSREYLHRTGRAALADYYDGKGPRPEPDPWPTFELPDWWHRYGDAATDEKPTPQDE